MKQYLLLQRYLSAKMCIDLFDIVIREMITRTSQHGSVNSYQCISMKHCITWQRPSIGWPITCTHYSVVPYYYFWLWKYRHYEEAIMRSVMMMIDIDDIQLCIVRDYWWPVDGRWLLTLKKVPGGNGWPITAVLTVTEWMTGDTVLITIILLCDDGELMMAIVVYCC